MSFKSALITEVEQEIDSTRKVLARLPADNWDYRPHEKSMSQSVLASHLVDVIEWGSMVIREDVTDLPPEYKSWQGKSPDEIVAKFNTNAKEFIGHIRNLDESRIDDTWRLKLSGNEVLALPRIEALRTWVLNHLVHHRAQLTVYLRLRGVPVPAIYGPSADEQVSFT